MRPGASTTWPTRRSRRRSGARWPSATGTPVPEYNPLVAFDLYNEPHDISQSIWLNGGETTDTVTGVTYDAAGMQQLYDTVRAAGSTNLTFISGLNWANTPPTTLVTGPNIVYAVHYYTCPSAAPPNCTNTDPYDPTQDLSQWTTLGATEPVMVTEFGWPSQDGWYVRLQRDRLRERTGMGLECLRLGGFPVPD